MYVYINVYIPIMYIGIECIYTLDIDTDILCILDLMLLSHIF